MSVKDTPSDPKISQPVDPFHDKVVKDAASVLGQDEKQEPEESLGEKAEAAAANASEKIDQVRQQFAQKSEEIEQQVDLVKARAEELNNKTVQFIQERPVVAVAGAFVVGFVVGKLALRRWLA